MLTLDEFLYIAGAVWVFSLIAYAVKKGVDAIWKKEKQE